MKLDPIFCNFLFFFIIGATLVVFQFSKIVKMKKLQGCTRKTTGIILQDRESIVHPAATWRSVEYMSLDSVKHTVTVDTDFIESAFFSKKKEEAVPIWYDPEKPDRVFIGETREVVEKLPQAKKRLWILSIFSFICAVITLMRIGVIA